MDIALLIKYCYKRLYDLTAFASHDCLYSDRKLTTCVLYLDKKAFARMKLKDRRAKA